MSAIVLQVDAVAPTLSGWAGVRGDPTLDAGLRLAAAIGGVRVGGVRRTVNRPDVDAHLGYGDGAKGFSVALVAISAFARLSGAGPAVLVGEGDALEPATASIEVASAEQPSLTLIRGRELSVLDAWFSAAHRLTLRLEGGKGASGRIALYQTALSPETRLAKLGETEFSAGAGAVSIDLVNPYLPVLIVVTDDAGDIIAADYIAFPSLLRGGTHALEAVAMGRGGDALGEAAALMSRLSALTAAGGDVRKDRITSIRFDPCGCTGAEPIFSRPLLEAVVAWLKVPIELAPPQPGDETGSARNLLERRLKAIPGPRRTAGWTLELHGGAAPTLSALIAPLILADEQGTERSLSQIVRRPVDDGRAWLVTPPAVDAFASAGPKLTPPAGMRVAAVTAGPAAIVTAEPSTRMEASAAFPRAVDAPSPPASVTRAASVLVCATPSGAPPAGLLQSIADQEGFGHAEVLYALLRGQDRAAAEHVLETTLPGRHRIVGLPHGLGRAGQVRAMAEEALEGDVVLTTPDAVLHDPRALALLVRPLVEAGVGSVCSMLVRQGPAGPAFASAGYYFSGLSHRAAPNLLFDTPDTRDVIEGWSPVAAPTLSVAALRRQTLLALPELPDGGLLSHDELRLGLELIRQGLSNLCTTAISATTTRTDLGPTGLHASLPVYVGGPLMTRLADSAVGLTLLR